MASLEQITNIGLNIIKSKLAAWQLLDALKTFFFPSTVHLMRMGTYQKTARERLDRILRPELKTTLYLPQEASGEYLYSSSSSGCCGIRILAEDSDIAAVDSAFKLLTSPDIQVAADARSHLTLTTERRIGKVPSTEETGLYLSGDEEGPFSATRGTGVREVWSRARMTSKRSKVIWKLTIDNVIITHQDVTLAPKHRRSVMRTLHNNFRLRRSADLILKPDQGRAMECFATNPA